VYTLYPFLASSEAVSKPKPVEDPVITLIQLSQQDGIDLEVKQLDVTNLDRINQVVTDIITLYPFLASSEAVSKPKPVEDPVINAIFLFMNEYPDYNYLNH
jgi:hypothetical protein